MGYTTDWDNQNKALGYMGKLGINLKRIRHIDHWKERNSME